MEKCSALVLTGVLYYGMVVASEETRGSTKYECVGGYEQQKTLMMSLKEAIMMCTP